MTIAVWASEDNGGDKVTKYKLWRDYGWNGDFTFKVHEYIQPAQVTFDSTSDNTLDTCKIYRYRARALNGIDYLGIHLFSQWHLFDKPDKPATPTKIKALMTHTSIAIEWTRNTEVY